MTLSWFLAAAAQHGGAADVDVLDGVVQRDVRLGDGLLEGIEVHHDEIDGGDAVLAHHTVVDAAPRQDAAVDTRMQCFHPPVHDLRKAGVRGHFHHFDPGGAQRLVGAAGRQQRDAAADQSFGQLDDPGLVGDAEQRPADVAEMVLSHRFP